MKKEMSANEDMEKVSSSKKKSEEKVFTENAYEKILCKSNEKKETHSFCMRKETFDMLDAISRGSEIKIPKATILHNLVSYFLKEHIEVLKENYSKKMSTKKDYLI